MLSKDKQLSSFSKAIKSTSSCFRPDNEKQLELILTKPGSQFLARGHGLSYGDVCLNHNGQIIDTTRLNHLLEFDLSTETLICQGAVNFADLFCINANYIPPVIPGTLQATVAGGIANDIHGKNNHYFNSFGQHIRWLELQIGTKSFHCSSDQNKDLFYATIGGLGLTGIIKRVAIKMRKASHFVKVKIEKFNEFSSLLQRMKHEGCQFDYQVAWLDLLNKPRAILSLANHTDAIVSKSSRRWIMPQLPFRLIHSGLMKYFNHFYFNKQPAKEQIMPLQQFNNPLDAILHWNRLYGKKGLVQFQAVFAVDDALSILNQLIAIIREKQATPTLAVLKYFSEQGLGLLSFTQAGFTIAIDFINNQKGQAAILAMNELITQKEGKIYLAKDFLLTKTQFRQQYKNYSEFADLLQQYKSPMRSDLSTRLGII